MMLREVSELVPGAEHLVKIMWNKTITDWIQFTNFECHHKKCSLPNKLSRNVLCV